MRIAEINSGFSLSEICCHGDILQIGRELVSHLPVYILFIIFCLLFFISFTFSGQTVWCFHLKLHVLHKADLTIIKWILRHIQKAFGQQKRKGDADTGPNEPPHQEDLTSHTCVKFSKSKGAVFGLHLRSLIQGATFASFIIEPKQEHKCREYLKVHLKFYILIESFEVREYYWLNITYWTLQIAGF